MHIEMVISQCVISHYELVPLFAVCKTFVQEVYPNVVRFLRMWAQ